MSEAVNPPRRYDSSRRQSQARETRRTMLAAGRRLFLEHGYAQTTVGEVASEAGVSVETLYKAFGNKPGLVKAIFDVAVVGDDEPVPMMEREFVQRNMAEPDPRKKLLMYGDHVAEVSPRTSPMMLLIRDAASHDSGAADLWAQLQTERLTGMTYFAQHLADERHLRPTVSVDQARDILWVHNSVELWDLLVRTRGWSYEHFGQWIGQQVIAALL